MLQDLLTAALALQKKKKEEKPGVSCKEKITISDIPLRDPHHYPSTAPFPVILDEKFPGETYKSRHSDIKSSIHWGQRKLLLSEIQLLCLYARPEVSYHIVYAGSAPGTHLALLDELFEKRHEWELIDPGRFDMEALGKRDNFTLRNEFFTNATAYGINVQRLSAVCPGLGAVYGYLVARCSSVSKASKIQEELQELVGTLDVARGTEDIPSMYENPLNIPQGLELLSMVALEKAKPLLFISDIRSGTVIRPNFEEHVQENMKAQECWSNLLQGEHAMLKFRLPYTYCATSFGGQGAMRASDSLIGQDGCVSYLAGDLLLPIWTRPTSTEGRLVVPRGAPRKRYSVQEVENQFYFFNSYVREYVHFNHEYGSAQFDHHFDSAAEANLLERYCTFMNPNFVKTSLRNRCKIVEQLCNKISDHLGLTFHKAANRRYAFLLMQAQQGASEHTATAIEERMVFRTGQFSKLCKRGRSSSQETQEKGSTDAPAPMSDWEKMIRRNHLAAQRENRRLCWHKNYLESSSDQSSGKWITVKMTTET